LPPKKPGVRLHFNSRNQAANSKKGNIMSKPTHIAYVVEEAKEKGGKGFWHEVGAVWPHSNGIGFDVVIHDQLSVSGRITCTERKDKEPKPQQ
jgi:hypothetical protein